MAEDTAVSQQLNLLLVEDDEVDRRAVRRALDRLGVPVHIVEASNGKQALEILHGRSEVAPPPSPYILLLDINMPQMDGIEMLQRLRSETAEPDIRNAIVFILTTSEAERDRERAYAHNIAGYLVKSNDRGGLQAIAEMLRCYREVVVFP
ncbi:MAG: response regulator [Kiloniellaceae bacterium]